MNMQEFFRPLMHEFGVQGMKWGQRKDVVPGMLSPKRAGLAYKKLSTAHTFAQSLYKYRNVPSVTTQGRAEAEKVLKRSEKYQRRLVKILNRFHKIK